ncbi:MAG: dual specificity protein phosphatase family protein [Pseudomonadota bacterium]
MQHVFWVYPGQLAGRPGPGVAPWDLRAVRDNGIDLVLSLASDLFPHSDALQANLRRVCIPFPDVVPPDPLCVSLCRSSLAMAFTVATQAMSAGDTVLVHCAGGYDRTGLLLARCIVDREGLSGEAAIGRVRAIRPYALSAEGWEKMAITLLSEC